MYYSVITNLARMFLSSGTLVENYTEYVAFVSSLRYQLR